MAFQCSLNLDIIHLNIRTQGGSALLDYARKIVYCVLWSMTDPTHL